MYMYTHLCVNTTVRRYDDVSSGPLGLGAYAATTIPYVCNKYVCMYIYIYICICICS